MTHDTHANGSSRQPGRRNARPDLGRPSLFADFDQESVEDIDPQRVRLLSTLESQRGARARPRGQRRATGRAHPWLTRALMVMMGLGMLVMLLSFMQLLRRPPPTLQALPAAQATEPAPMGKTQVLPEHMAAISEAAEIIEVEPPAGGLHQASTSPAASAVLSTVPLTAPPPQVSQEAAPAAAPALTPTTAATPATPRVALGTSANSAKDAAHEADRLARSNKATPSRSTTARRDSPASPDDVALVEAMLAHAGPRKAPQPPTEALKQCGSGTSPETSVCRARICVQHPRLAACHTP